VVGIGKPTEPVPVGPKVPLAVPVLVVVVSLLTPPRRSFRARTKVGSATTKGAEVGARSYLTLSFLISITTGAGANPLLAVPVAVEKPVLAVWCMKGPADARLTDPRIKIDWTVLKSIIVVRWFVLAMQMVFFDGTAK